jgi:molecular chaperone DnaJ
MKDFYNVLGVSRVADTVVITNAYRSLAQQWHPDRCKDPTATAKFQEVREAYEILCDERGRKQYDTQLAAHDRAAGVRVPRPEEVDYDGMYKHQTVFTTDGWLVKE